MDKLLFDSFALLCFFQNEPGGDKVRDLLRHALKEGTPRLINAINVGELVYITQRRFGAEKKLEMLAHIHRMGLTIIPCPNDLIYSAAELKASYPISYAGAFALATALEHSAALVTGDPEFRQVEHLVKVVWV
jgi:predicted nucleic acid-binding protein